MTNREKYKDTEERAKMFCKFCSSKKGCVNCQFNKVDAIPYACAYAWAELEYKEELLPCPFCGGEAKLISSVESWVECSFCGINTKCCACDSGAIEKWNRRMKNDNETIK